MYMYMSCVWVYRTLLSEVCGYLLCRSILFIHMDILSHNYTGPKISTIALHTKGK